MIIKYTVSIENNLIINKSIERALVKRNVRVTRGRGETALSSILIGQRLPQIFKIQDEREA